MTHAVPALTIERLSVWLVESPIAMTRLQGVGHVKDTVKRVLVRLDAGGLTGWGEAAPWEVFTGTAEAAFAALDRYLRPAVIGHPANHVRALLRRLDKVMVGHAEAKFAIETACFDLLGQASGLSIAELLGGRVRDTIPLSFSIADPDFAADLDRMRAMLPAGHRLFKVKTGVLGHAEDLRRLGAIRDTFGDAVDLRIDYNQALTPLEAMRILRDVDTFRPTFIEQPVPRPHLDTMAALAAAFDTPLLADESCFDATDLMRVVAMRAADAISVKLMKCGGMLAGQALMGIADTAGLAGYAGTLYEGGIALAAGTQFVAAMPGISLGCEFYMPHHVLLEDVLEARIPHRDGMVVVPQAPGLGIRVTDASVRNNTRVLAEAVG